jgi:hypothetical protein
MPTSGAANIIGLFPTSADGNSPLNLVQELGGTTIDPSYPSGVQGCYVGYEAFGASTYWWDANGEAQVGSPPRPFTQDYYDIKPINCAPYWIGAAFCAWDGGRLANDAEYSAVWTSTYPWPAGTLPVLGPGAGNGALDTSAAAAGYTITEYTVDYYNGNLGAPGGGLFYFYPTNEDMPAYDSLTYGTDLSPEIASPGRFIRDVTAAHASGSTTEGWQDVGANMMEYKEVVSPWTNNGVEFCDTTGTSGTQGQCYVRATQGFSVSWTGGSWEGHPIQRENYVEPMFTQYGKAGFRCARAAEP